MFRDLLDWIHLIFCSMILCALALAGVLALPAALTLFILQLCRVLHIAWWIYLLLCGYGGLFAWMFIRAATYKDDYDLQYSEFQDDYWEE